MNLSRVLAVAAVALLGAGCGLPSAQADASPTPPATPAESPVVSPTPLLGDACLVGRWIDQRSIDSTDWTFNGQVVRVVGLAGLVLDLSADGTQTYDWSLSQPLVGTYKGQQLKIVLRGLYTFKGVTADGSQLIVPKGSGTFTAQFFLGGRTESTYSAHAGAASTLSYTCTTTTLLESEQVGSQTNSDSYVRT